MNHGAPWGNGDFSFNGYCLLYTAVFHIDFPFFLCYP